jgi:hypothetical protein
MEPRTKPSTMPSLLKVFDDAFGMLSSPLSALGVTAITSESHAPSLARRGKTILKRTTSQCLGILIRTVQKKKLDQIMDGVISKSIDHYRFQINDESTVTNALPLVIMNEANSCESVAELCAPLLTSCRTVVPIMNCKFKFSAVWTLVQTSM